MHMKKIHVDENVTIRTNEEADEAFLNENDFAFYDKEKGVVKVSKERWEKAQRTERKHWMDIGIGAQDDRNFYHAEKFDNYKSINSIVFKNALEVGCGPFTNLRLVGEYCKIKKCSLNDPLINDYLTHPNCSYNRISLKLNNNDGLLCKLFPKKLPIKNIYSCAFEEIPTAEKFDLIVIINVIEHCFDLDLFFQKVISVLDIDGIIIFEDKLFTKEGLEEDINTVYDAAHPIRANKKLILDFLRINFQSIYCEIKSNTAELAGKLFEWDDVYFIGRKK